MIINGSTNDSGWTYKLEVQETATSIENNTSTVQIKAYIGRASSRSFLGGAYSVYMTCDGQNQGQNGTIDYPTYVNAGEWLELKTFTYIVPHNIDGTKTANIESEMLSSDFTPSHANASDSMVLTPLHKPPTIATAEMTETDANMISLGVPNTTIVQYLSKKTITLHGTAEDGATLTYRLEHFGTNYNIPTTGYQSSNVFNADYTQNNITISNDGKANIVQKLKDSLNGETTDWVYVNINNTPQKPNGIAYTKPLIERTSTTIKRKSGNGTNLTDNKVSLNLKATFYKANDIIGNHNAITQVGYKIWATDENEPANYTSITPTISGSDVTISSFEISNINFTKVYNYKIIVTDIYNYSDTILDGRVPIGQSIWTEYKDHVDFLKLTIGGYNPFEFSDNEIIVGLFDDGYNVKPIYRKTIEVSAFSNVEETISTGISNIDIILKQYGGFTRTGFDRIYSIDNMYMDEWFLDKTTGDLKIKTNNQYVEFSGYITFEYTKI